MKEVRERFRGRDGWDTCSAERLCSACLDQQRLGN